MPNDRKACAALLARLIEHHPELPVGVDTRPGTKNPVRIRPERVLLQSALALVDCSLCR